MTISRRRKAFTLLEVLLVMAIIVIIMAVAYPSMEAWWADARVQGAADEVRGAWAEARVRAIDSGIPYRFAVKPDSERYRIAPETAEFWDGNTDSGSDVVSDDGKVLIGSLPKDIVFKMNTEAPETAGGWMVVATFLPDGTSKDNAEVHIAQKDGSYPIVVSVRSLTGITRVQPQKQREENP